MARPRQQRLNPSRSSSRASSSRSGSPARRGSPAPATPRPATARDWIGGARLRTLPLAVSPVAVGSGAAALLDRFDPLLTILALLVAITLQIGVNFANDYSDGVRGTDAHRAGPARLTGSGAARPRTVLIVALAFFGVGAVAGVAIVILSQHWWLLAVGAACIAAAWFYTGGRRPYGYYGLGEVFVFVFFGLVATAGTTFIQAGTVPIESWLGGTAVGLLACGVLMANNLRDIPSDRAAGKRTLAVLIGPWPARGAYCLFVLAPFGILAFFALVYPLALLVFFALLIVLPCCLIALTARTARELILVLQLTSLASLVFALGLGAAFAF